LAALQCESGDLAVAQGIVAQARVLGGSIGIAASSAVVGGMSLKAGRLGDVVDERNIYAKAFSKTMWVCAVIACVALVASVGTYQKTAEQMLHPTSETENDAANRQEVVMEKAV
jgi:hypothetical protein